VAASQQARQKKLSATRIYDNHYMHRRHFIKAVFVSSTPACAWASNQARGELPRDIKLIATGAPAGGPDVVARSIAEHLEARHGFSVQVLNQPQVNGERALAQFRELAADGRHWLLAHDSALVINPSVYPRADKNPLAGLAPVAQVGSNSFFLLVKADDPIDSVAELVRQARAAAEPLHYGSGGVGSMHHLAMEDLAARLKLRLDHVPYKSGGEASLALARGDLRVLFAGASALTLVKAGKLRLLAVASPQRSPRFPGVPSLSEVLPGFKGTAWFAWFGREGTSPAMLAEMNALVLDAMSSDETRRALESRGGVSPTFQPADSLRSLVEEEHRRFAALISRLPGVRP
jgi:tripartite-type tricarboxylate transporter receptor subunit TctC